MKPLPCTLFVTLLVSSEAQLSVLQFVSTNPPSIVRTKNCPRATLPAAKATQVRFVKVTLHEQVSNIGSKTQFRLILPFCPPKKPPKKFRSAKLQNTFSGCVGATDGAHWAVTEMGQVGVPSVFDEFW